MSVMRVRRQWVEKEIAIMKESEEKTRKNRIDEKLKSPLLNWIIIHNDKVSDYKVLTAHAVEEFPTETGPADYALFVDAAGDVIKYLMEDCDVHTILRLPNGTFTPYSHGVKANVIFFQKGLKTENIWIYDCRTNIPGVTKKDRTLALPMFEDFEKCYGDDPNGQSKRKDLGEDGRFRKFTYSQIKDRDFNLGISWLKDENLEDPNSLPEPQLLVADAITELGACVDELQLILDEIEEEEVE
ncbi:MAG: N-6 DNA methylase [Candidatus Riflebacteria bacterium]|nr:N-6 DNA methylase [Candidatus Riflebacteria bacterium]